MTSKYTTRHEADTKEITGANELNDTNNPGKSLLISGVRENELSDDNSGNNNSAFLYPYNMLIDSLW